MFDTTVTEFRVPRPSGVPYLSHITDPGISPKSPSPFIVPDRSVMWWPYMTGNWMVNHTRSVSCNLSPFSKRGSGPTPWVSGPFTPSQYTYSYMVQVGGRYHPVLPVPVKGSLKESWSRVSQPLEGSTE